MFLQACLKHLAEFCVLLNYMKTSSKNRGSAQQPVYDVIISGAGPVGLFLACELALAKCAVLILEKAANAHSPLKQLPFGVRGLSAPAIEALHRRGLLDQLEVPKRLKDPHSSSVKMQDSKTERQVGHFAGIPFFQNKIDETQWRNRLPSSTPTHLVAEMEELETVLTRRAEELGVEIRRGAAVTDLHQADDTVTVQSGDEQFKAGWLVGCDGSRSVVRKIAGFDFAGTEPEFTGYSARVDIADPEKLKPGRNLTSTGLYLQSQPGFLVIQDFDGGAFHHSDKPLTREHIQEVLRRISETDVTISALHIGTTWTDRARQTTSYRNGRILLAGDAAHIHAPLGGQGLNLGIGDAINLGWKLAAVIHDQAPQGLLDTYQQERYPVGAQVLDWSRAQVAIMKPDPQARALYAIMRELMATRDGATYVAGRVWGIQTHYNFGDEHPLYGHSVPNFEFSDGKTIGEMMRNGRGILLDLTQNDLLKNLADQHGEQISYISGKVKDQLGLNSVLIRPDGIMVWIADDAPDLDELKKIMKHWFA